MCLNNLSVYTGDYNIFHEKSLYPFHGEQAPKLISFTFDHPVPISLPCPLPEYVVLDEDWLDVVPVVPGQLVNNGGEDLTHISDDRESERNANNSKDDTEYPARQSDRGNVPIAYSGENSGAEEH